MRITMQRLLNLQGQALHPAALVGRPRDQPDPYTCWWRNHPRSTVSTRRSVTRLSPCPILMSLASQCVRFW